MKGKPKKGPREKDLTSRYLAGGLDEDRVETQERFRARNKTLQQEKTLRTALMRAEEESGVDIETLPIGRVIQVYSLYSDVEYEGKMYLCVVRKTLQKVSQTQLVVGDLVRFRSAESGAREGEGEAASGSSDKEMPEAVIEQILPRATVLTRADSFKGIDQHPIVANAQQMLIVASLREPRVKWGLVDRMLIAAQAGGLRPIVCLNKVDLAAPVPSNTHINGEVENSPIPEDLAEAESVLGHYQSMGIRTLRTSAAARLGLDELREILRGQETVLAGHSGVGKSTLINAIQPRLDLRTGAISRYNNKGRHTTTSARHYPLDFGGAVIDTPGVKLFGLWGVTADNLLDFFPDVANDTAPEWRKESYSRILESI